METSTLPRERHYPERGVARGITSKDLVKVTPTRAYLKPAVFEFDSSKFLKDKDECSIDWLDDEGALSHLLAEKKDLPDGSQRARYRAGVAIVPLEYLEMMARRDEFFYLRDKDVLEDHPEFDDDKKSVLRKKIAEDPYHGNLYIGPGKERRDWARQMLANLADWISIEDLQEDLPLAFERI